MWYWSPSQLRDAIDDRYEIEAFPINDLLPYPHIVYVISRRDDRFPAQGAPVSDGESS